MIGLIKRLSFFSLLSVITLSSISQEQKYGFVALNKIPNAAERAEFTQNGFQMLRYYPQEGYVISYADAALDTNNLPAFIKSFSNIVPLRLKLNTDLRAGVYNSNCIDASGLIRVTVSVYQPTDLTKLPASYRYFETGIEESRELLLHPSNIESIASLPFVEYVDHCLATPVPDNLPGRTSHRSNAVNNTSNGIGAFDGSGVNVMMQDDGAIGPHIDHAGRINQDNSLASTGNHGDHVAGTIMGAGNLNPYAEGMASGAFLYVYRAAPTYNGFSNMANAYNNESIRITSTSYSDGCNAGYTNRTRQMDIHSNTHPSLLHVFSAGNEGGSDCNYGAGNGWGNITGGHKAGKNVIAVANLTTGDALSGSSSRGPAHDGRIKPEIGGVGTSVYSTIENNAYDIYSGTSMSCPGVSGVLAQLYEGYNSIHGQDPAGAVIKAILMNTADDLGNPGPDFRFGFGKINALRALDVIANGAFLQDTIDQGEVQVHDFTLPSGTKELKIMLYWHDVEAATGASIALVNDLDFKLVNPNGDTILPWVLDHTPVPAQLNANAIQAEDHLNNVEQITIVAPDAGLWKMVVTGHSVPFGPQGYVLTTDVKTEAIRFTYPAGGEGFSPYESEQIRWEAPDDNQGFTISFTNDDGNIWTFLTNAPATSRNLSWSIPDVISGECRLKIERGGQTHITDKFNILRLPTGLKVLWACNDSLKLAWNPVLNATEYEVFQLGSRYMEPIDTVQDTCIVVHGTGVFNEHWFAVKSHGANSAVSRRTVAIPKPLGFYECPLNVDAMLVEIITPIAGILPSCHDFSNLKVAVAIQNVGLDPISNIPISYRTNGGTTKTEIYTGTIQPGVIQEFTFSQTEDYSATAIFITNVWVDLASDSNPYNDSLTVNSRGWNVSSVGFPVFQNFENETPCSSTATCTANCVISSEWLNEQNNVFDNIDWRIHSGPTPTIQTGPSMDANPGTAEGKYAYVEATDCFQRSAHLLSPCIDVPSSGGELRFKLHAYGGGIMGSIHADLFDGERWHTNITAPQSQNSGFYWQNRSADLTPFAGKTINIRFRVQTGSSERGDFAIDDISVGEPLSVNDFSETKLSVYPNPANDVLHLSESVSGSYEITDTRGRVVLSGALNGQTIHLANLDNGLYILQMNGMAIRFVKMADR